MDYRDEEEDESSAGYLGTIEQREREELDFYTDLAVQEVQRWVESITRKKFKYPDDPKASLADGVLLCELLNGIMPGTVKRINRLPTPMAGMDNLNVFIDATKRHFGLKEAQLFTPTDLQDFADRSRDVELSPAQLKETEDKKIRNVAITVFWLARQVQGAHVGPEIDFTNFAALVNAKSLTSSLNSTSSFYHQHQYSSSGDWTEPDSTHYRHSRTSSRDSAATAEEMLRRSSAPGKREGRYSSSDSLDDLNRPNSQNSDRSDPRRTSTALPANNPLQFIALRPAVNLAQKAEKQLELVQETKKKRESVDKDETEWQTNLSSWKQRRKSKSSSLVPEREANELQTEKYQGVERSYRDGEGSHYSQSQSSQSYDDDEACYSPPNHQKSSSDSSSPREEYTTGSTTEFKPYSDEIGSHPILDIIERATIKPVESQPLQSASLRSSSGSMQPSLGKNKMRVMLMTDTGNDDGFGFTIKGGKDKCLPITIESVMNDSAADKAELLEGDEVLEINEEVVSDRNRGYCMLLINGSLQKTGKLEMYIKRDYAKVSNAAKERKQSSNVAPKSILDIYDSLASKSDGDSEDAADGKLSARGKDMDKMEDERTKREMEREYRQILDGGYDSAVSTLRSEITMEDRQAYLDSQEKITPSTVHASYMTPPSEYASPQDYEDRKSASVESLAADQPPTASAGYREDQEDSDEEADMETFEQIHDKVTKDFEEVAPSLVSKGARLEKRSKQMDKENHRRRMEEWQRQQDARQQEQYEKEQSEIQRQIEKSRQEAEDYERNRKNLDEAPPVNTDEASSTLSSLRIGISAAKEMETRDKAVQRLLEIKARYNRESLQSSESSKTSRSQAEPTRQEDNESEGDDDLFAEYRINNNEEESKDMKDRYTANYFDYKPVDTGESGLKETPYLSDVYKYYDEDIPSNLGERDPTPPPMSRKDVMNMNKKSTPWRDAKDLPPDADRSWERRDIIAPVDVKVSQPWKRPEVKAPPQDNRRKSMPAPNRSHWRNNAAEELQNSQSKPDKHTDVDPNLPTTLRKEDVLKMTREKARFSAQPRRASEAVLRSQPINHKDETDQRPAKPQQRNSMGFFSNRAMFEEQSKEADRYWADQSKEAQKQPVKYKPAPIRKAVSTVHAPNFKRETRSKSMDLRPQLNRGDIVRSVDASDAAYERMKELAQMKQLREAEAAKAEDDERERLNRERKLRDERQRELAEISKMNQQYEAAHIENTQQQQYEERNEGPGNRSNDLNRARQRMAKEAEELARAQMRHDADVKSIHGVDMQEERRRRDLENSRPTYGEEDDQRHSRELGDLDRNDRADTMAKRRHQELVEQSRRDQMRREEARQIQQRQPQQQQRTQSQQHSQRLHPQSQQQQQQEWRPQQQQSAQLQRHPPESQRYPSEPQTYSKSNADSKPRYKLSSPDDEEPRNSNQNFSTNETGRRYEDNYAQLPNGYGRRESSNRPDPGPAIYQTPRLNSNSQPIRVEGGSRPSYSAPQEVRSNIEPQIQSTQRTTPPYGSNERKAPKGYERQQPIGNSATPPHQDSFERDIPDPKPLDRLAGNQRLNSDERRQDLYDRNVYPGYSSANGGFNDSPRSYPSEQGRLPSYRNVDSPPKSRTEETRYAHSFNQNGGSTNSHNNNDIYKRDKHSKEKSPESSLAPSKPPRGMQNQKPGSAEDDMVTVSAKYSCAYCSKELGKGAAMVIESLGLYYHVECFRCCVCHSLLSNGQMGADVRVRGDRLHCKNCYSNDDAGIKYSAV